MRRRTAIGRPRRWPSRSEARIHAPAPPVGPQPHTPVHQAQSTSKGSNSASCANSQRAASAGVGVAAGLVPLWG